MGKVLILEKYGGDFKAFKHYDKALDGSDLENYRLRAMFTAADGLKVTIDFETWERPIYNKNGKRQKNVTAKTYPEGWLHGKFPIGRIYNGVQQYTDCVSTPREKRYLIEPTKQAVMEYCNKEFGTDFDTVDIKERACE